MTFLCWHTRSNDRFIRAEKGSDCSNRDRDGYSNSGYRSAFDSRTYEGFLMLLIQKNVSVKNKYHSQKQNKYIHTESD